MSKFEKSGYENRSTQPITSASDTVFQRLEQLGIIPNENLGQHFLIDDGALDKLADNASPGNLVIEVGAGVGQLTERLAARADRVVAIEIDRRYEAVLEQVQAAAGNVAVLYGDAVSYSLENLIEKYRTNEQQSAHVVTNLPYHISEPFLHRIIGVPLESISLLIGSRFARALQVSDEASPDFSHMSLLAQTFFRVELIDQVPKTMIHPPPRTESSIVNLLPKDEEEIRSSRHDYILRRLILTAKKNPMVKNVIKEGLIEFEGIRQYGTTSKRESHQRNRSKVKSELRRVTSQFNSYGSVVFNEVSEEDEESGVILTQNQARAMIEKMGLSTDILEKSLNNLTNNELATLSRALR